MCPQRNMTVNIKFVLVLKYPDLNLIWHLWEVTIHVCYRSELLAQGIKTHTSTLMVGWVVKQHPHE